MSPDFLLEATNIAYMEGTVTREGGSAKYNAAATADGAHILGGWDWWPDSTTQRMVVWTGAGTILKDSGSGNFPVTLRSLNAPTFACFVEGGNESSAGNRKLFIFSGNNHVQVLSADGVTTTDLSSPPADWAGTFHPVAGCVHENRLWGWGNLNDPHRVYASLDSDHEDFLTTPFSLSVFPGEGERIVAGVSFKGALVLLKYPAGVYFIDTSASTVSEWRPVRLTQAVGGSGPGCLVVIDNDVLILDRDGSFHLLSAAQEYGNMAVNNISMPVHLNTFVQSRINLSQLSLTRGVYYPYRREAHFTCSSLTTTAYRDRRLVVDFNDPQRVRFRYSDKDICQSLWLRKDSSNIPRLTSGDAAGFVWHLDQDTKSKDGAAYQTKFQTPHTDLSFVAPQLAIKRKLGDFLEMIFQAQGAARLYCDVLWDGKIKQTISFNIAPSGSVFGTGRFGTFQFGGTQVVNLKRRLVGSGRRVSFIFRNQEADQSFAIAKALLHFREGDERL